MPTAPIETPIIPIPVSEKHHRLQRALPAILVILVLFSLHAAREFFIPVVFAIVMALLLLPLVRTLKRGHIHEYITATVIIAAFTGAVLFAVYSLRPAAQRWVEQAPDAAERIESFVSHLRKPVEQMGRATESIDKIAGNGGKSRFTVRLESPGVVNRLLWGTMDFAWAAITVIFILFFLLGTGGELLRKLARLAFPRSRRSLEGDMLEQTERSISKYLATVTAINAMLGTAIGTGLWLVGLPNPILWGVLAGLFNFVPYLGGLVGVSLVTLAASVSFESAGQIIAAPATYVVLNSLEGMVITPAILGRRFALDPCVVFIWLFFWGWMWGVPGALLAMPILTIVKIAGEHMNSLQPLSSIIGGRRP